MKKLIEYFEDITFHLVYVAVSTTSFRNRVWKKQTARKK